MALININYQGVNECINRMEMISQKINDIYTEFEMKNKLLSAAQIWDSPAVETYKNHSETIKQNLSNAYTALNDYRNLLYRISSIYSNLDKKIQNDGENL